MSRQYWAETLQWSVANGTTISNSTVEALVFPDITVPGGYMQDGRALELLARGRYSNVVTTPGTLIFRLRWGGIAGTVLAQTSAIALSATAQTDVMFTILLEVITRVNGATGSLLAMGHVLLASQLAASNNAPAFMGSAGGASGNTPAAVTADLSIDKALSLTAQFSVATSPTNLTGMNYLVKSAN